ncbi:MAG: hypothetical protein AB1656_21175 [Candidatus Omnitrophota bacterium]
MTSQILTNDEIRNIYGALSSELNRLSIPNIRNTVRAAGFDVTRISHKSEDKGGIGSRAEVMPIIDELFGKLPNDDKINALRIIAEKLIHENSSLEERVQNILGKHGFQFIDNSFIPIDLLDQRESKFLPTNSASHIAQATSRLINSDYSGAITSACGAVDILMQKIYKEKELGEPGKVGFQAKVNTSLKELHIFELLRQDFQDIDMTEMDITSLVEEMKKATNHAVQFLEVLRRSMGDVHGSKPALRHTAYYAIKLASAICGLFENSLIEK